MQHDIVVTTNQGVTQVRMTGDLTVRNAKEIAGIFREITGEEVHLVILEPSAIDLSFLQLLISGIQALTQKGSHVRLHTSLRDADTTLLTNTGFSRLLHNTTNQL